MKLPRFTLPLLAISALLAVPSASQSQETLDAAAADSAADSILGLCSDVWTFSDERELDDHLATVDRIVQRTIEKIGDDLIDLEAEHELVTKVDLRVRRQEWADSLAEAIFQAQIAGESGSVEQVLRGGSALAAAGRVEALQEEIDALEAKAADLGDQIAKAKSRLDVLPIIGRAVTNCGEEQRAWIRERTSPATAVRAGTLVGQTGGRCTDAGGTLGFFIGLVFEIDDSGTISAWLAMNPQQRLEPSFSGKVSAGGKYYLSGAFPFSPYGDDDASTITLEGKALPESAEGIVVAEGTTSWISQIAECEGTWTMIPIEKS